MKTEHRDIIERAKLLNLAPSDLAHELTVRDMVEAGLFEIKNIHAPWAKLNEGAQQEVIDRLTKAAEQSVWRAISIIASRGTDTIPLTVADAKFKQKAITITALIDAQDPNRHGLIDVAGKLCLLVLSPNDYAEALDSNGPDRDQHDLPLHVSDLTGSLFDKRPTGPDEPDGENPLGSADELAQRIGEGAHDPLYSDAIEQVIAYGRLGAAAISGAFKISTERAGKMLEAMVAAGIAVSSDDGKIFEVLANNVGEGGTAVTRPAPDVEVGKEFGDFTYDDASQLIVLKADRGRFEAAWVQSRLAIDSDKATTLLLRLLDNGVIELETEGATALEHSYKVVATLADVT